METQQFTDRQETIEFYENRYAKGYMGFWPAFEKKRVYDIVRELNLPKTGKALDFGCGRGIFTSVLKNALPGWEITGYDISREAIVSAGNSFPGIRFFAAGDTELLNEKFDFIFSHHVLEHTFDETAAAKEICGFANEICVMLHILPCSHPGSLEYNVSMKMKDGFDPDSGKFFFEDPAHLRRLNADQTAALFQHSGFYVWKDFYANQFAGSIRWIAGSSLETVLKFTDPLKAINFSAAVYLSMLRLYVLFLWFCTFSATLFRPGDRGRFFLIKKIFQLIGFVSFFWLALPVYALIQYRAQHEWKQRKTDKGGSELFIILKR